MTKLSSFHSQELVSVIMCVYNAENYISDAITSILNQTYTNWELIIINDCSTDTTTEIVDSFTDTRIKVITNQRNSGPASSRNTGINHSKGKYIALMDADDISIATRLEEQVSFFTKHPQVGVVGSLYAQIDNGNKLEKGLASLLTSEHLKFGLRYKSVFGNGTVMFNTNALPKDKITFNIQARGWEDLALWVTLADLTDLAVVPKVLYLWRSSDTSLSKTQSKNIYTNTISLTCRYANEHPISEVSLSEIYEEITVSLIKYRDINFYFNQNTINIPLVRELQRYLWEKGKAYISKLHLLAGIVYLLASIVVNPLNFLQLVSVQVKAVLKGY